MEIKRLENLRDHQALLFLSTPMTPEQNKECDQIEGRENKVVFLCAISYKAGFDAATKELEPEVNRLTYELDKSRDSHTKKIAELMRVIEIQQVYLKAILHDTDEKCTQDHVNECLPQIDAILNGDPKVENFLDSI